ncbi:response regulator [Patescibacteria group bacterium]|nr:response regulator [Patescibacteria group bacterium]MBU4098184.1 response regulator [Patescibacteria group bacterium]
MAGHFPTQIMRILLVEDDKFFREFYAFKLKEKNLEVGQAGDGEEALKIIPEFKPDIILLDLIMPKKDGFELLQDLSSDNILSQIPVLVFSTLGQQKDIDRAMQLGAKGYVNKSFFDFDNLLKEILQLVKK